MIETDYTDLIDVHQYTAFCAQPEAFHWAYPAAFKEAGDVCVLVRRYPHGIMYGRPPSEALRTLVRSAAPWYVVLDRLIEEYPEWADSFDAAARV